MRRFAAILLLLAFVALGSGALQYCHALQHEWQDRAMAREAGHPTSPDGTTPLHNDQNCETHAQLHMPIVTAAWLPVTLGPGMLIGLAEIVDQHGRTQNAPQRINCRSPPSC